MIKCFFIFFIAVSSSMLLNAQVPVRDTSQPVNIISARNFYIKQLDPKTEVQILSGKVEAQQGNTLFYCDSCVINNSARLFEAFGHVHINDNDTVNVYSDHLRYLTNTKMAYLTNNVKLDDGHAVLTTNSLDYNVNSRIAIYRGGGKVINKNSVLTSNDGVYYADIRDIYFKNNVILKDPAQYLKTDSLLFNTVSQRATFISQTYIRDSSGRVIRTREGYYDMRQGHAVFTQRTTIVDGSLTVVGDRIANDDSTGIIEIEGRGVLIDTAKGINILANRIFVNKKNDAFLATSKPLMIIKQENDSIYITADTLFSAHLSDLHKKRGKDSAAKINGKAKDSTDRYFEAYRHVRVFTDSVQAVSDSLFYSFKDSIFHLYQDPVVWSKSNQITGDTIFLYTKNKKADHIKTIENSFMVSEVQKGIYNQIKSTHMDGYFREGVIDSVRARGMAESIYFIQDNDSAFTNVNQTKSDAINLYFEKGELFKVVLLNDLTGTIMPVTKQNPSQKRLSKFRWLDNRRPKTKFELLE